MIYYLAKVTLFFHTSNIKKHKISQFINPKFPHHSNTPTKSTNNPHLILTTKYYKYTIKKPITTTAHNKQLKIKQHQHIFCFINKNNYLCSLKQTKNKKIMKKHLLLIIVTIALAITTNASAKQISEQEAQTLAYQFINKQFTTSQTQRKLAPNQPLSLKHTQLHTNGETPIYYIFNQAEKGFIIVSADDNIAPIIGYSDNGSFDETNMPDNFKEFLNYCKQTIENTPKTYKNKIDTTETKNNFAPYINPLLDDITFTQSSPYNKLCPQQNGEHTAVGCVALSMAQIMTYYQHPKQGTNSNTYTSATNKFKLSVNFSEATYDWNKILHSYKKGTYTDEQANEVAKLLFHCGVATNMDYGIGFSGSNTGYCILALTQYFDYDKRIKMENRALYTQQEWENIIKKELNENRPIIYGGVSATNGGHAFNCDGYDENNMFHINWGWGGYCNGYFNLRLLEPDHSNPEKLHNGYALRQHIVIGIQPNKEDSPLESQIQLEQKDGLSYNKELNEIKFECSNYGIKTFTGELALGLYNEENQYLGICDATIRKTTLQLLYTTIYSTKCTNIPIQKNYRVMPFYKENDSEEWIPLPGCKNAPSTLIADYDEDSTLIFKNIEQFNELPLQVISLKPIGNVYQKRTARFHTKIKNSSNLEYYGPIVVYMVNHNNPNEKIKSEDFHVTLKSGEEDEYEVHIENVNTSIGNYYCYIAFDSYNQSWTTIYGEYYDSPDVNFSVIAAPTEESKLTITKKLEFANTTDNVFNSSESPILTTTIENKGGYAQIYVAAVIFDSNKKPMHAFATKKLMIDKDETIELSYECNFNELTNGNYYLNLQYYSPFEETIKWKMLTPTNRNLLPFSIADGLTAIENTSHTEITAYPTKTPDIINISAEENILNTSLFSLTGTKIISINPNSNSTTLNIQSLNQGIYLLIIETPNHKKTLKINKI